MRFRVLGPLQVRTGEGWSDIRAAQPRLVLAVLLIEARSPVSTDRLVEEIWPSRPPPTAIATIQGYVMRLRRLLGPAGPPLVTRGRTYALMADDDDLDAAVFERLVRTTRSTAAVDDAERTATRLTEALALWRGAAFADVPATPTVDAEIARLQQCRLTATEDRLDVFLGLDRHAQVVGEAARLVADQPLRERPWAQLMTALYRSGRRAEALDAYQRARSHLIDELGLEPGQPLRRLQRAILDDDPTLSPAVPRATPDTITTGTITTGVIAALPDRGTTPAQLPPAAAGFTGRDTHLHHLDRLLPEPSTQDDTRPPPVGSTRGTSIPAVSVLVGPPGVGKTATAVHWAHRASAQFPDGQLFAHLRGNGGDTPLPAIDVLARFLRALGTPATRVPEDPDEASALYRTQLAGRRMLVVLDDAADPEQVRPLLPGAAGCAVLITSRHHFGGLVAVEGADRQFLDVLTPQEARAVLINASGSRCIEARPDDVAALARLCGHLPLALRIAAANLASHPGTSIQDQVARLTTGDRLTGLALDGEPHLAVRGAFGQSYDGLSDAARRTLRLIGLVPGPHVSVHAVAALTAETPSAAAAHLDELASACLIEELAGRYSLHDLMREYAAELALVQDSPHERTTARERLFAFYVDTTLRAAARLCPEILLLPGWVPLDEATPEIVDHVQASVWLDAERPNLVAAVRDAASAGPAHVAWRLADALRGYLYLGMHVVDWRPVAAAGLAAAEAAGHEQAQAAAQLSLASLHWVQGRHVPAVEHHTLALALAQRSGWAAGATAASGNLGNLCWALGRLHEAAEHYERVLAADNAADSAAAMRATASANLGLVHFGLGRLGPAVDCYRRALVAYRREGSRQGEARVMMRFGEAYHALGLLDDARRSLDRALVLVRTIGDRNVEGDALRALASVHRDEGALARAQDAAVAALAVAEQTGDQRLIAGALTTRAGIQVALGDVAGALAGCRRALAVTEEVGNRYVMAEALLGFAHAYHAAGESDAAASAARQALEISTDGGYRILDGDALALLAHVGATNDDHAAAEYGRLAEAVYAETGARSRLDRIRRRPSRAAG